MKASNVGPTRCANPQSLDEGRQTSVGRYLLQREVAFVQRSIPRKARAEGFIDVGCGGGSFSLALQAIGVRGVGLDRDWPALAAFQQRSPDAPLVQGNALHMPFTDGSLGFIIAIHCFDHLDRIGFLQECSRVLRSGGWLIFDLLNRHSYKLLLKRLWNWSRFVSTSKRNDRWTNVFSSQEALRAIANTGFNVQAVEGYGWIPFDVNSESQLVPLAARVEQALRLGALSNVSPRLLVAARKDANL